MEKEEKIPFISDELIDYLEKTFHVEELLGSHSKNMETPGESLGLIKGVRVVISTLKGISRVQKEEANEQL